MYQTIVIVVTNCTNCTSMEQMIIDCVKIISRNPIRCLSNDYLHGTHTHTQLWMMIGECREKVIRSLSKIGWASLMLSYTIHPLQYKMLRNPNEYPGKFLLPIYLGSVIILAWINGFSLSKLYMILSETNFAIPPLLEICCILRNSYYV